MAYTPRIVDSQLEGLLQRHPAISVEGARGVGKTTTALQQAATSFHLDEPGTLELVLANSTRLVQAPEPILIDEWQRYPSSWDLVRRAVDEDRRPGRFILTGSASPSSPPTHSGALRILTMRMRPMSLAERWQDKPEPTVSLAELLTGTTPEIQGETQIQFEDYIDEIVASGFPGTRDSSSAALHEQVASFCDRIVDHDFRAAGHEVRNPPALRRWLTAFAAATSTTASLETIRDAAAYNEGDKQTALTTKSYRDTLERLWVSEPLPAWLPTTNQISRLTQGSKHHLVDPALAVSLLALDADALMAGKSTSPSVVRDGAFAGNLFESLMALNLRVFAQAAGASVHHFRTFKGERECDFIIERRDRKVLAVEVKLKQVPYDDDVRHLHWLKDKLGDDLLDMVCVTTGRYAYRRQDGVAVVPAALLGP